MRKAEIIKAIKREKITLEDVTSKVTAKFVKSNSLRSYVVNIGKTPLLYMKMNPMKSVHILMNIR